MLLERWQIDILAGFGVCLEEVNIIPPSPPKEKIKTLPAFEREYLSIVDRRTKSTEDLLDQLSVSAEGDDILADWLTPERESKMADVHPIRST